MAAKHLFVVLLALFACIVAQSVDELNIPDENDNQFPPDNHSDGIPASEVKVTTIEPDTPYQITESEITDTKKLEEDSLVTVSTNDSSQTFEKKGQTTNTAILDQSNISLTTSAVDDIPAVTDNTVQYSTDSVEQVSDDSGLNEVTERDYVTEAVETIDELKVTGSTITNEVVTNAVTEPSVEVTESSDAVSEASVAVTSNTIHESDAMLAGDEPQSVTELVDTSDTFQTNIVDTTEAALQDITGVTEMTGVSLDTNTTDEPIQRTWESTQLFLTGNNDETQTETTQTGDETLATHAEIPKTEVNAFNLPLDIPKVAEETLTKSDVGNQDLETTPELSKTSSENVQSLKQIDDVVKSTDDTGEQIQIDLPNETADHLMTFGNIDSSIVGITNEESLTETTESTFRTTENVLETTATNSDTDLLTEITTERPDPTIDLPEKILENGKTFGVNSLLVTEEPRLCPGGCICITELDSDDYKVDCSGRQLTALPKPLDPKTTELNLQNNNLTEISDEISALTKLKVLNANNNDIMEIMSGSLSKLPELTSLNLGNNRLLEYPQELVNFGLSKLKELDLGGNDMELKPDTFSNYTTLRKLILPAAKSDFAKHICNNLKDSLQTVCTGSCDIGSMNCSDASDQLKGTLDYTMPGLIALSNEPNNVDEAIDNKTELKGIKQIVGEVSPSAPSEENAVQLKDNVILPTEAKNTQTLATENAKSLAPSGIENVLSEMALPGLIAVSSGTVVNTNENKNKDQPPTGNTAKVEDVVTQSNDFSLQSAISKEPATDLKDKVDNTSSAASKANADIAVGAATEPNKGGVDKSVIGIIVAGMVLVVAGVTIKKNWKSIKNKFNSSPRTANDRVNTNGTSPEEVPLQQKMPV